MRRLRDSASIRARSTPAARRSSTSRSAPLWTTADRYGCRARLCLCAKPTLQTRVDVKAHCECVTTATRIRFAPWVGAPAHGRTLIVDANRSGNAVETAEGVIVHRVPQQLVFARRPHARSKAGVTEPQVELVGVDTLARDKHARPLGPVGLRLCTRRCFDAAASPACRPRKVPPPVTLCRFRLIPNTDSD
jgi:hypothetical protein